MTDSGLSSLLRPSSAPRTASLVPGSHQALSRRGEESKEQRTHHHDTEVLECGIYGIVNVNHLRDMPAGTGWIEYEVKPTDTLQVIILINPAYEFD